MDADSPHRSARATLHPLIYTSHPLASLPSVPARPQASALHPSPSLVVAPSSSSTRQGSSTLGEASVYERCYQDSSSPRITTNATRKHKRGLSIDIHAASADRHSFIKSIIAAYEEPGDEQRFRSARTSPPRPTHVDRGISTSSSNSFASDITNVVSSSNLRASSVQRPAVLKSIRASRLDTAPYPRVSQLADGPSSTLAPKLLLEGATRVLQAGVEFRSSNASGDDGQLDTDDYKSKCIESRHESDGSIADSSMKETTGNETSFESTSRHDDSEGSIGRSLRRSARESMTRIRTYFQDGDESEEEKDRDEKPFRNHHPARKLLKREPASPSFTTRSDEDELAPPVTPTLEYPHDERKIAEIERVLHETVTKFAQCRTQEHRKIIFAKAWLEASYEPYAGGFNVSRTGLYAAYTAGCERFGVFSLNTATFGKIIRQVHPGVRTRRLGGRTNSRYHYIDYRPTTSEELARLLAADDPEGVSARQELVACQPASMSTPSTTVTQARRSDRGKVKGSIKARDPDTRDSGAEKDPPASPLDVPAPLTAPSLVDFDILLPFQAVFEQDGRLDLAGATFWDCFGRHVASLRDRVQMEDFELFLSDMASWWSALTREERELVLLPDTSRAICDTFVELYRAVLNRSTRAMLEPTSLASLSELKKLAEELVTNQSRALQNFKGSAFFNIMTELAGNFAPLVALSRDCRLWVNALRLVFSSRQTLDEIKTAWNGVEMAKIKQRCAAVQGFDARKLQVCFNWLVLFFSRNHDSVNEMLAQLLEGVERGFEVAVAGQLDPRSTIVMWSFVATQVTRELSLRSSIVACHFQTLRSLIEDLLMLHLLRREVLPATASPPITLPNAARSISSGTSSSADSSVCTAETSLEALSQELCSLTDLTGPQLSCASPLTRSPARAPSPAPPSVPTITVRESLEQSPSVSSSPMSMPPRRAPLVAQAVQRANLAQELLAVSSPPPFVLSPRMLASFADRQRASPLLPRSPNIGAYAWSNERGFNADTLEVEGAASSSEEHHPYGPVGLAVELAEAGLDRHQSAATEDWEVPNTAAYYSAQWR